MVKIEHLKPEEFFRFLQVQIYLPHITDRDVELDTWFEQHDIERKTILVTAQLITATEVALRSDVIFITSAVLKYKLLVSARFISKATPRLSMYRNLDLTLVLIQHKRTMGSPVHSGLREKIEFLFANPEIVSQVK